MYTYSHNIINLLPLNKTCGSSPIITIHIPLLSRNFSISEVYIEPHKSLLDNPRKLHDHFLTTEVVPPRREVFVGYLYVVTLHLHYTFEQNYFSTLLIKKRIMFYIVDSSLLVDYLSIHIYLLVHISEAAVYSTAAHDLLNII